MQHTITHMHVYLVPLLRMHLFYYFFVFFVLSCFLHRSATSPSRSHCFPSAHDTVHPTASQQFCHLNRTPAAALLVTPRFRAFRFCRLFLIAFLFLSGDIELNPGPSAFTVCTLNIRSILHPLHSAAVSDFVDTHNPDLFCD